jgi:hypothetical protein
VFVIRFKAAVCCIAFFTAGLARSAFAEAPSSTNYYPLEVGNKWTCQVRTNGSKPQKIITRVTGFDSSDGEKVARLEAVRFGNVVGVEYLNQDETGVYRHWVLGKKATPPLQILRYPVKDGDRWESKTMVDGKLMRSTTSVKVQEMTAPEGTFKIAITETTLKAGPISMWAKTWYVPDNGIARQEMTVGPVRVDLELESFESGKK